MIRVLAPGPLTTVQDLGRHGYAHLGVSASGAADALSLRAANRLVGNHENAPALEMTLAGGAFEFEPPAVVALTGAAFEADLAMWRAAEVRALRVGPSRDGARCYLAVRGGIDVPLVMGSASTHVVTGLGGRPLRKGDTLHVGGAVVSKPCRAAAVPPARGGPLRVTPGPQAGWFSDALYRHQYLVTEASDRMGLRLKGPPLEAHEGHMLTEGVPLGAVQVPPDGQPIILFVEHQTTGGYPKIANLIGADLHAAGQLRPRDIVVFEAVDFERALELWRAQEAWLHALR